MLVDFSWVLRSVPRWVTACSPLAPTSPWDQNPGHSTSFFFGLKHDLETQFPTNSVRSGYFSCFMLFHDVLETIYEVTRTGDTSGHFWLGLFFGSGI